MELLRIIAMLLIVMHHVGIAMNWEHRLMLVFGSFGELGVNIFVLISSYFMVNKKFKLTRILNIVLQTTFYSLTIYVLFIILGNVEFTIKDFVYNLLPVFYDQWWFVTAYIILLLLSPALNIILQAVNKKTLGLSILGMVSFTVLFPYISLILTGEIFEIPYLNRLFVFIELYCVGGYIKLHGVNLKKVWVVLITITAFIISGFAITLIIYSSNTIAWREIGWYTTFSNFVGAIGLLLIFKDFKFKSKIINTIASTTFGIYLIHENNYMRSWEFQFCRETIFQGVTSSALTFLLLTIMIFILCMVIDYIRQQTIHRLTNKFLRIIDQKVTHKKIN